MDKEFLHFEKINRETWQNLHRKSTPPLSQTELNSIKSFNDRINLQDVRDVYLPLTNLIGIYKRSKEDLAFSKGIFLQKTRDQRKQAENQIRNQKRNFIKFLNKSNKDIEKVNDK